MKALVSVVMSVYNAEVYLRDAMDSVLAQKYSDFEFVVVDDGSTDQSLSILIEYQDRDSRVRVISRENRGLVFSLNEAIEKSNGSLIARMDADDICHRDRFLSQVEYLESHKDCALVGSAVCRFDNNGDIDTLIEPLTNNDIKGELRFRHPSIHPTWMFRKDIVCSLGGYREIYAAEDYDLLLRISEGYEVANLNLILLKYRVNPKGISNSTSILQQKSTRYVKRLKIERDRCGEDTFTSENMALALEEKWFLESLHPYAQRLRQKSRVLWRRERSILAVPLYLISGVMSPFYIMDSLDFIASKLRGVYLSSMRIAVKERL